MHSFENGKWEPVGNCTECGVAYVRSRLIRGLCANCSPEVTNTMDQQLANTPNPKDIIGRTKPPLWLVPAALMILVSKVMALGAKKYGPYNWRKHKVNQTVYLEAAMRHILSALDGEDSDAESNQSHEAHAAACMGIILDARATGNLIDDRPTKGAAAELIRQLTEKKSQPPYADLTIDPALLTVNPHHK